MKTLVIDVVDNKGNLIGMIKVLLSSLSKSKNSINFRGKFPVLIKNKSVGMASIVIKANMKRPEAEVLQSFEQNELRTIQDVQERVSTQKKEDRIIVPKRSLTKVEKPQVPKTDEKLEEGPQSKLNTQEVSEKPLMNYFNGEFKLKIIGFECAYTEIEQPLFIETWLYRPCTLDLTEFLPDSFTVSSISRSLNSFFFNSKTTHSLEVVNSKNIDIRSLQMEFIVQKLVNEMYIPIGESSLLWQEIIENNTKKSIFNINIYKEEQVKGALKLQFSHKSLIDKELNPKTAELLLLNIEYIYRLERLPNLYVKYKAPFDGQLIVTNVFWNYNGRPLDHELIFPGTDIVQRLNRNSINFEVWEKMQEKDVLLGIGKASLLDISPIFPANVYPTVCLDDLIPVISQENGTEIAYLKVSIAYGTSLQVNRFCKSRYTETLSEITPKTENKLFNNLIIAKEPAKKYIKASKTENEEFTFLAKNRDF